MADDLDALIERVMDGMPTSSAPIEDFDAWRKELREILGWQPIDTAPMDVGEHLVGRLVGCRIDWMYIARRSSGRMWKMEGGYCDPTHWLDMPTRVEPHA